MSRYIRFSALLLLSGLVCGLSHAGGFEDQTTESRFLSDRWNVNVGGYLVDIQTEAAIGFNSVLGALIFLEDDLDFSKDQNNLMIEGQYRFGSKSAIEFGWFAINRNATKVLDKDITIPDPDNPDGTLTYQAGATLNSSFDSNLFRLAWRYSFINDGKTEAGLSVGFSTFRYDYSLDGQAMVDDGMGSSFLEGRKTDGNVLAPIPTIGIFVNHAFTKKVILRAGADFFNLQVSDYYFRLVQARLTVDYYFIRHLGIGGGFGRTTVDYQNLGGDPFTVSYEYGGFLLYATMVF